MLQAKLNNTHLQEKEMQEVKNLTSTESKNYEVVNLASTCSSGWQKAALNSFRVYDGSGTLISANGRCFVLAARHTMNAILQPFRGQGIPISYDGKVFLSKARTREHYPTLDYVILEFMDRKEEEFLANKYGGVEIVNSPVEEGEFIFQLGYPNSWPKNQKHLQLIHQIEISNRSRPTQNNILSLMPENFEFSLVLTSGVITSVMKEDSKLFTASARSGHGNSGGGIFVLREGQAFLAGVFTSGGEGQDGNAPLSQGVRSSMPDSESIATWLPDFLV